MDPEIVQFASDANVNQEFAVIPRPH